MTNIRISDLDQASPLIGDELIEVSQPSASVTITASTISFAESDNSISDSGAGFVIAGFTSGNRVRVTGAGQGANNIFVATITALTATKMTIGGTDGDVIVNESAGAAVTISKWETNRTTSQALADLHQDPPTFGSGAYSSFGQYGRNETSNTGADYQAAILATSGIVAYYPMDDSYGSSTISDAYGSSDGIKSAPCTLGIPGRLGDKTCCYCYFQTTPIGVGAWQISRQVQDDFTIEFWMMAPAPGLSSANWFSNSNIIGNDVSGNQNDFAVVMDGNGYILFGTYDATTKISANSSIANSLLNGRWNHVCATRQKSSGNMSIYLNGTLSAGPTAIRATQQLSASTNIYIGGFVGFISDVAFYNSVLSGTTISDHFDAGSPYP